MEQGLDFSKMTVQQIGILALKERPDLIKSLTEDEKIIFHKEYNKIYESICEGEFDKN